jgi:hypothetical protein
MRFLSIIAAAGAAVAAAVAADSAANEANRPKAVLLEIGKEYTAQELENLQANAGALDCAVAGRIYVYPPPVEGGVCSAHWIYVLNIESYTNGETTNFPSTEGIHVTSNTAIHNFCLHFVNNICKYHLEAPFQQAVRVVEEEPYTYGDANPDGPTLRETCITIHSGEGGTCPAVASDICHLDNLE